VDSEQFARGLAALKRAVSAHAEHEEREEFPYLGEDVRSGPQV
jgi:hypothetical protein